MLTWRPTDGRLVDAAGEPVPLSSFAAVRTWLVTRLGKLTSQVAPSACIEGQMGSLSWGSLTIGVYLDSAGSKVGSVDATYPTDGVSFTTPQPQIELPGGVRVGSPISALTAIPGTRSVPHPVTAQGEPISGYVYNVGRRSINGWAPVVYSEDNRTVDSMSSDEVCWD